MYGRINKVNTVNYLKSFTLTHAIILAISVVISLVPILVFLFSGGANEYYLGISVKIGVYLLCALGLNFVIGYTGLLDLGYIAIFGIGAYVSALLSIHGFPFWVSATVAIVVALLVRFLIGLPVIRLRGDYLAIATLGFGEITRILINNLDPITNGPRGLPGPGQNIKPIDLGFMTLSSSLEVYIFLLVIITLGIIFSYRIEYSRIGRALIATREDEIASSLIGIKVTKLRLFIFAISAIYGATAGVIYTHYTQFITPKIMSIWDSFLLVAIVVVGGIGSIPGVIIGSMVFYGIPEILRDFLGSQAAEYRMLVFGIIMLLVIIFRPQGLVTSPRIKLELKSDLPKVTEEERQSMFDIQKK